MKHSKLMVFFAAAACLFAACNKNEVTPDPVAPVTPTDDIYQFSVLDGNGDSVSLRQYHGKVIMVITSATKCCYTPEYSDIERIYESYQDQGFIVLDFPCNQFGNQAPGSYDEIHDFVVDEYSITFPQFAKIDVNGANASPLYVWLKSKKPGNIPWNFTTFLINRDGEVEQRFDAQTSNMRAVERAVQNML